MDLDTKPGLDGGEREFASGEVHVEPVGHGRTHVGVGIGEHPLDERHVRLRDLAGDRDRRLSNGRSPRRGPSIADDAEQREIDSACGMHGLDEPCNLLRTLPCGCTLEGPKDHAIVHVGRVCLAHENVERQIAKLVTGVLTIEDRDGLGADVLVGHVPELLRVPPRSVAGCARPEGPDETGGAGRQREALAHRHEQRLDGGLLHGGRRRRRFERGARHLEQIDGTHALDTDREAS